jgi:hypothetical protein
VLVDDARPTPDDKREADEANRSKKSDVLDGVKNPLVSCGREGAKKREGVKGSDASLPFCISSNKAAVGKSFVVVVIGNTAETPDGTGA